MYSEEKFQTDKDRNHISLPWFPYRMSGESGETCWVPGDKTDQELSWSLILYSTGPSMVL